jgi:hypothetical protein
MALVKMRLPNKDDVPHEQFKSIRIGGNEVGASST